MRIIKFRQPILDRHGKFTGFHYWGDLQDSTQATWTEGVTPLSGKESRALSQQFTGLTDRLGKEIYEGDIARDPQRVKGHQTVQVFWSDNCAAWMIHNNPRTWSEHIEYVTGRLEVIGNIYENSELLEPAATQSESEQAAG